MTPRFIVRPAAEADIAEAALWYEFRSLGLGTDFLRAVDVCFAEIQRSPERFPQVYRRRAVLFCVAFPMLPTSSRQPEGSESLLACK